MHLMGTRLTNHLMRVLIVLIAMMLTAHGKFNFPFMNKLHFHNCSTHSIDIALAHLNGSSSEHETSESECVGYGVDFRLVRPRFMLYSRLVLGQLLRVGQNLMKVIICHMLQTQVCWQIHNDPHIKIILMLLQFSK